jgi:CBS domain containing-hemolysin-like protein
MNDGIALLAMVGLLGLNAFFVGAEFALISARRDRVATMVDAGTSGAATVLRATEHLSMMMAAAQLGITICSLALGALGEPALAHLIEEVFSPLGVAEVLVHPIAFVVALLVVTVLHIVIGEMVPKNIAIAGPERTAIWLVPPLVVFLKGARPVIVALNWVANHVLRLLGVVPKDEREAAFTTSEIAEMLSESRREGLLDASQTRRLTQALHTAERSAADVLIPRERLTVLPANPTVGALEEAVARTGFSRYPVQAPEPPDAHPRLEGHPLEPGTDPVLPRQTGVAPSVELAGYLHIKDVLDLDGGPDEVVPVERVRALPRLSVSAPVDEALATMRREGSHLARAVDGEGTTVGVVALEDLVEEYVGTVRDSTHVARSATRGTG